MTEWSEVLLGDLCDFSNGANFTKDSFGPGLKIIGVGDFGDRLRPEWETVGEVLPTAVPSDRAMLEAGDIVIVRSNGNRMLVGRSMVIDSPCGATHSAFTIRPDKDRVLPRFLGYQMRHIHRAGGMGAASGTNITNLNQAILGGLRVLLPSLATQQAIIEVLGSLDDLIENNRRRIEILEEMAQAIYREWFVHFRFPGHETATFVDSPLGPIPEDWVACMASEVLTINPRVKALKEVEDPFFTMGDLSEKSMVCVPSETKSGTSGSKFVNGDTLFARITPCLENGKTGYVSGLEEGQVGRGSTEFIVLRGKLVGPAFTYLLARSPEFRGHAIASMSGASGRQRVRNECFDSYDVAIPMTGLVDDFEQLVRPMLEQAFSLHLQSKSLKGARDVLLPKLVSGEIDVSNLDLDAVLVGAV